MIKTPSLSDMFEAGVHFGHKRQRSSPTSKRYVFTLRDKIYVIDLEKTQVALKTAADFLKKQAKEGKTILFLGTKRQASPLVQEKAKKVKMPYISFHWPGGFLTNFEVVRKTVAKLKELEESLKKEEFESLTKREKTKLKIEFEKKSQVFEGVKDLAELPDVILMVDPVSESTALREALKLQIPVVALCDTNADLNKINYPIPCNDDSQKSIELILEVLTGAILEGKKKTTNF